MKPTPSGEAHYQVKSKVVGGRGRTSSACRVGGVGVKAGFFLFLAVGWRVSGGSATGGGGGRDGFAPPGGWLWFERWLRRRRFLSVRVWLSTGLCPPAPLLEMGMTVNLASWASGPMRMQHEA